MHLRINKGNKPMIRLLTTAALALLMTVTANAATITANPRNGCDVEGCYDMHIDGIIQLEDSKKFDDVIKRNNIKAGVVILNSDGGNMLAGMLIGVAVHDHKFMTYVPQNTFCASMCASIWIAGDKKFVADTGHVGFHQPYSKDRRGHMHVDPRAVAFQKEYYAKIGVPKPAADFFTSASPNDMYWMNADLASGFGIDVTSITTKKEDAPKLEGKPVVTTQEHPLKDGLQEQTVALPKAFIDSLTSKEPMNLTPPKT
jgi:ATP-dependent protease ClpP protease subunit